MSTETKRARGTGSVVKLPGSRFWYILFYVDGKQRRESSKTESRAAAESLLRKRLGEAEDGRAQLDKKLRYEDVRASLLLEYSNKQNKSLRHQKNGDVSIGGLKHLDSFFTGMLVSRIDTDTIQEFVQQRLAEGAERPTVNRALALLRRMFYLAKEHGKIQNIPYFPMQKENAPRQGFLDHDEFRALLDALPIRFHPLVIFLYFCGVRVGEATQITWNQVDLNRHQIRLEAEQAKNAEARILPLPAELVDHLRAIPIESRSGLVFFAKNFRNHWNAAVQAAFLKTGNEKFDGLLIHDLRRSAVRNLIAAGVPEKIAMRISGHKTRHVFDRYMIVSTGDLHNAMGRVQAAAQVITVNAPRLLKSKV
ncbi:MAG: hypothetical protein DMG28_17605 [Acidobacteria bacterium]|nr:MAG: hypothetical protein DMG28_17605 [Acidobacteriota bacterium]